MRVHVISDLVDGNARAVFSSLNKVREYLSSERKTGSVLNQGAWISIFNIDHGLIWEGVWEWVDDELKMTQGDYAHSDCVLCGKNKKVAHLDKYNRCFDCLMMEEGDE